MIERYLTIGELARRSGVAASGLRFYESLGLISSQRTGGNQRRYERATLRRVGFIRAAARVGLTLDEIAEALATLPAGRTPTAADWALLSRSWRPLLDARIAAIERLRDDLDSCIGCGCLSLERCALQNPADRAAALGPGARYLTGDSPSDATRAPASLAPGPGVRHGGETPARPLTTPEVTMKVIVIGALGKVARHLLPLLAQGEDDVVGVVREPDQLEAVTDLGARAVHLDVEHASTEQIATALEGADAVVWSAGAGGGDPDRTYAVDRDAAIRSMEAASVAAVPRYVMVSWIGSVPDHGIPEDSSFYPYADAKLAADDHLRGTSLDWTILGPGSLTDDDATGLIERVPGDARLAQGEDSAVPRADVAQVVADTLHEPATVGQFVRFRSGSTPIADALRG